MNLSPIDRLQLHLKLHIGRVKLNQIQLSPKPGYVVLLHGPKPVELDIRGVGYPSKIQRKYVSVLRLWNELHDYFSTHVEVVKVKNGQPTQIQWSGCVYTLNPQLSYREKRKDRHARKTISG